MAQPPAMPAFRYRAFISYSHRDASWADWLHKALETYRVPSRLVGTRTAAGIVPRRLVPIFRDRDELASATDLGRKVNEALAQSANLIVICSPRSATSRWVQEEVLAFKRLGRSERIFCLIVDGEPNASECQGREAEECFAPALRFRLDADGQLTAQQTEPIAADARADKDGRRNAKLKLIAGLLDISFDSLKQRELQRRNRRLTAITAAALVIMAVTTSLAIVALAARHAAEVARVDAERRQRQAENLVGFMLGDLNTKLQQVERLDIMEDVDTQAMNYFASMPTKDVTDQVLAERAKALEKIGSVRQEQGHLPEAIASYEAASTLAATLAKRAPTDTARQLQYARLLAFVGQAHWLQGQLDLAQSSFDEARNVLVQAEQHAGADLDLQFHLEMIDNDIGHVQEARGRLDEAQVSYRSALDLSTKLVAAKPDNAEWAVELGGAHNNLGKLALLHGDLATAIAEYGADDAIESALSSNHPEDNSQRESMLTVRAILGRTQALAGADDVGIHRLQESVDMASGLIKSNPHNSDFQEDFARYATQLARLKRLNGDLAPANDLTAQSLSMLTDLVHQSPTDSRLQRELAEAQTEQAAESLAAGQADAARTQAQAARSVLDPLLARQPHDRACVLATMAAQLVLADVSSDLDTAKQLRQGVVAAAKTQSSGQSDPRLLSLQVEAMLALGGKADAQRLIQQLWLSGYRDAQLLVVLHRDRIAYPANVAFQKRLLAENGTAHSSG
ncbi:toll/interleukin-1 receptor domain-containing protein [Dyella psychrodurans]|uniref:Toll/interleukin-1 receptor domain-containing protein n=1 Tax=Dyella psychrodurans TaxID=1927960 RepID=A0A370WVK9_9GAMM|nr:toll/interleukin-1 receptor domain-containing protein [Dyella psychrodurans]RDS80066.1 toll/interleukin-1 receptor domain-containing protein [Dyella psychrodurans]